MAVTDVMDVAPALDAFKRWPGPHWDVEGKDIRLEKLTVRTGYTLQLHAKMQPRRDKQLFSQKSALNSVIDQWGGPIVSNSAQQQQVDKPALFQAMWSKRCGNPTHCVYIV